MNQNGSETPEDWEEIQGFQSSGEFERFKKWISAALTEGVLEEIEVQAPYGGIEMLDEKWFRSRLGTVWRMVAPEAPFSGVFERVTCQGAAMSEMTTADPRVSEAVVLWIGFGSYPWPQRDENRIVERFGGLAPTILPLIKYLYDEFFESDARHECRDLVEMGDRAASEFRAVHPEVSEDAVEALCWCYTFNYK